MREAGGNSAASSGMDQDDGEAESSVGMGPDHDPAGDITNEK